LRGAADDFVEPISERKIFAFSGKDAKKSKLQIDYRMPFPYISSPILLVKKNPDPFFGAVWKLLGFQKKREPRAPRSAGDEIEAFESDGEVRAWWKNACLRSLTRNI